MRAIRPAGSASTSPAAGAKRARARARSDRDALPARRLVHLRGLRRPAYTAETLAVTFHGRTIADVLDLSVRRRRALRDVPWIRRVLQTLDDVGLGYITLGQAAPTLSGGEAQWVKLAAELARPETGNTLYILDEPTTGLHFDDVRKLLEVLHRLADLGNPWSSSSTTSK